MVSGEQETVRRSTRVTTRRQKPQSSKDEFMFKVPKSCNLPLPPDQPKLEHHHPMSIIHTRPSHNSSDHVEYSIHYAQSNRMPDEWVALDPLGQKITRDIEEKQPRKRRRIQERNAAACLEDYETIRNVKNIGSILLGNYEMETFYFSPLPPEYNNSPKLYICKFCLMFFNREEQLERHMSKCLLKHPLGNKIYCDGKLSVFEVDGEKNNSYGYRLCYLGKMFLSDKSLNHDVDYFRFYILFEVNDRGYNFVGYFSKEKYSNKGFNLACLLILPPYQTKGYGKFLIAFSYELSKKEGTAGTPEKPLSDLGRLSYKRYWTRVLLPILKESSSEITVKELSHVTSIWPSDIFSTLHGLNLIQEKDGIEFICRDHEVLDRHLEAAGSKGPEIDLSKLIWKPYKPPQPLMSDAQDRRPIRNV